MTNLIGSEEFWAIEVDDCLGLGHRTFTKWHEGFRAHCDADWTNCDRYGSQEHTQYVIDTLDKPLLNPRVVRVKISAETI